MRKIKPTKDYKWGIEHKAVSFKEGIETIVPDLIAERMVSSGYAEACEEPEEVEKVEDSEPEEVEKIEKTKKKNRPKKEK